MMSMNHGFAVRRFSAAFILIELLAVIAILAILADGFWTIDHTTLATIPPL